jgi:ATP-dependent DNA helicase RecQ
MVLSCVARTQGRFGRQVVALMLVGSNSKKMKQHRLDQLSTFGLLDDLNKDEVVALVDALVSANCLRLAGDDPMRPTVELSDLGREAMRRSEPLDLSLALPGYLFEKLRTRGSSGSDSAARATSALDEANSTGEFDRQLLAALQAWRADAAREAQLPPHYVVSNATLESIAQTRPDSSEALLAIKGIGEAKLRRYGRAILSLVGGDDGESGAIDENEPENANATAAPRPVDGSEPSHYWSWRMLSAGLTVAECAAARGLERGDVLAHAARAIDSGWPVRAEWFFSADDLAILRNVVTDVAPKELRSLLGRLPESIDYALVELFVKCSQAASSSPA